MPSRDTEPDDTARTRRTEAIRARVFLVVLCLGWGTTWVSMRIALTDIPPFSMRIGGLTFGIATLVTFALIQGRSLKVSGGMTWLHLAAASFLNIVAFSVFTPFAQLSAETSRVAIVVYTMPIWATLMALPVLGERLTATITFALALCVAGLAVLIWPLAMLGVPAGILLALGAAVSWAAGTVYLKWAHLDGDPMAMTLWQLVIGLGFIAAALPVVECGLHLTQAHTPAILGMIFSGVVGSGLSYFLWFDIVRRLPASTASLGILATPVVGVIAAMLILDERPTLADAIGFALMLAASACVLLRPR